MLSETYSILNAHLWTNASQCTSRNKFQYIVKKKNQWNQKFGNKAGIWCLLTRSGHRSVDRECSRPRNRNLFPKGQCVLWESSCHPPRSVWHLYSEQPKDCTQFLLMVMINIIISYVCLIYRMFSKLYSMHWAIWSQESIESKQVLSFSSLSMKVRFITGWRLSRRRGSNRHPSFPGALAALPQTCHLSSVWSGHS